MLWQSSAMLVTKHAYNAQKQARHALNAVWKTICTLIQQLPAASKNALRAYWKTQAEIFAYRAMKIVWRAKRKLTRAQVVTLKAQGLIFSTTTVSRNASRLWVCLWKTNVLNAILHARHVLGHPPTARVASLTWSTIPLKEPVPRCVS